MAVVTDARVAEFVTKVTGKVFCPPFTVMGIERKGEIVGGVIFNHYEGSDVHISVAGKGWTKGFYADVGDYIFRQLKCERFTCITEQPEVVRLAERLGGKVEGLLRNHFGKDRDGFIVGILEKEYRF